MGLSGRRVNHLGRPRSAHRVELGIAQMARHDGDRDREGSGRTAEAGDQGARPLAVHAGRQDQHRDVLVLVDELEDLLRGIALADDLFRRDAGDTVGARARARQHGARLLMRLGPHDVGNPEPLLIAVVGIDHAQHDDADADAGGPAAGEIERAVALRRIVDDNEKFRLVAGLVTSPLTAHRSSRGPPPRPVKGRSRPPGMVPWGGIRAQAGAARRPSGRKVGIEPPAQLRTKPTMSLTAPMVSAAMARARLAPSTRTPSRWAGSCMRRFISVPIGPSRATARSTSAALKVENCAPPKSCRTSALVLLASAAKMPTRLSASGRFSRPFSSCGRGSGSVLALRTFWAIVSASSVRLMRE